MSLSAAEVEHARLNLADDESIDDQDEVEAAWREELLRRIEGIENGTRRLCSWDDVDAAMRRAIDARRRAA